MCASRPLMPALMLLLAGWPLSASGQAGLPVGTERASEPHAAVVRAAERALLVGPFTVMHKGRLPPSGDKHDFLSLAPYWWPDPARPDGLPYVRRDGEVNPASKVDTDDTEMARMFTAVGQLAAGFRATGEERFAARGAVLLRTWFLDPATLMHPHLEYGQGVPGRSTGRAEGIIDTRRFGALLDAARALEASPSWPPADQAAFAAWCRAYATWLQTSTLGRAEGRATNNHGTWYDAQLAALLVHTGQHEAAVARLESAKLRLAAQIQPDGRQPLELERTRALSYSVMNLEAWFSVARLAAGNGVDLWHFRTADGRSLRAALDYLVPFIGSATRWPHAQITPFDAREAIALLDEASRVWNEPAYGTLAARLRAESR